VGCVFGVRAVVGFESLPLVSDELNSLTAMGVQAKKKLQPHAFSCKNQYKKDKKQNHNHNHLHCGKRLPPPPMWVFYLQPIQCKHDTEKSWVRAWLKQFN
jgi:hypothetical protein